MTVLKTSMRNFFAHKGRMALSAVAVLLSVAFVCGTLVFTDTMNTTFDKLFAATSSDVTVSAKGASDSGETTADNGKPPVIPASVLDEVKGADGVKSAEGTVFSTSVTVTVERTRQVTIDVSGEPGMLIDLRVWRLIDTYTLTDAQGSALTHPAFVFNHTDGSMSWRTVAGTYPVQAKFRQ